MIVRIPDGVELEISSAVFDYNGTIALDGKISPEVRARLSRLAQLMPVYVLTADTNGNASEQCADLPVRLMILTSGADTTQTQKASIVARIGAANCVCFGNGFNDVQMLKTAALSIAVLGDEGLCPELLPHADILVKSIQDGIDLLLNKNRIIATLRG